MLIIESKINPRFAVKVWPIKVYGSGNGYALFEVSTNKAYSPNEFRDIGVSEDVILELQNVGRTAWNAGE